MSRLLNGWVKRVAWATVFRCAEKILSEERTPAQREAVSALMHDVPSLVARLSGRTSSLEQRREALRKLLPILEQVAPAASQPIIALVQGGLRVLDYAGDTAGRLASAPVGTARLTQVLDELEALVDQPTITAYLGSRGTNLRWMITTSRQWLRAIEDIRLMGMEQDRTFEVYLSKLWGTEAAQSLAHALVPWLDSARMMHAAMSDWGAWAESMMQAYDREQTSWGKLKWLLEVLSDKRARRQVDVWSRESAASLRISTLDQLPVLLDLMRRFESFPAAGGWAVQGKWALDVIQILPELSGMSQGLEGMLGVDEATWGALVETLVTLTDPHASWTDAAYAGLKGFAVSQYRAPGSMLGVLAQLPPLAGYMPYARGAVEWGPRLWAISREYYRDFGQATDWADVGRRLSTLMHKHFADAPYVADVLVVLNRAAQRDWKNALIEIIRVAAEASPQLRAIYDTYLKIGIVWKVVQAIRQANGAEANTKLLQITDTLREINTAYGHPYVAQMIDVIPLLPVLQDVRRQMGSAPGDSWFEWADHLIDVLASHPNESFAALRSQLGQQVERRLLDSLFGLWDRLGDQSLLPAAEGRPTISSNEPSGRTARQEATFESFMDMGEVPDVTSEGPSLTSSDVADSSIALPVLELRDFTVVEGIGEDDADERSAPVASWNLAPLAWGGGAALAGLSAVYATYRLFQARGGDDKYEDIPLDSAVSSSINQDAPPLIRDNRREQRDRSSLPWLLLLSASVIGAAGMGTMAYRSASTRTDSAEGVLSELDAQVNVGAKSRAIREVQPLQTVYPLVGASLRAAFDRPLEEMLRRAQRSDDHTGSTPPWSAASRIPIVAKRSTADEQAQPIRREYTLADIALGFPDEELRPRNLDTEIEWPADFPQALRQRIPRSSPVLYQQLIEWGKQRPLSNGATRTFAIKIVHSLLHQRLLQIGGKHTQWQTAIQRLIAGQARPAQVRLNNTLKATEFAIPLDESGQWLVIDIRGGQPFVIQNKALSTDTTETPRTLVEQPDLYAKNSEHQTTLPPEERIMPLKQLAVTMLSPLLQTTRYHWDAQLDAITQYLGNRRDENPTQNNDVVAGALSVQIDEDERSRFLRKQVHSIVMSKKSGRPKNVGFNSTQTRIFYADWLKHLAHVMPGDATDETAKKYVAVLGRYGSQVQLKVDLERSIETLRVRRRQGKILARALPVGQARVEAMRQYLAAANLSINLIDDTTMLALANRVLNPDDVFYDETLAARLIQLTAINYYVSHKASDLDRSNDESSESDLVQAIVDELYVEHKGSIFKISHILDLWGKAFSDRYGDRKRVGPQFKSRNSFPDRDLAAYYEQFNEYKKRYLIKDVAFYAQQQATAAGINQLDLEGMVKNIIRADIVLYSKGKTRGIDKGTGKPGVAQRTAPSPLYVIQAKSGHFYAASVLSGFISVAPVDNLLLHPHRLINGNIQLEDEVSLEDLAELLWPKELWAVGTAAKTPMGTPLEQLQRESGAQFVKGSMVLSQVNIESGRERLISLLERLQRTAFDDYIDAYRAGQLDKSPFEKFLSLIPFKDVITREWHDPEYTATVADVAFDVLDLALTLISIVYPVAQLSNQAIKALSKAARLAKLKNLQGTALRVALVEAVRPFMVSAGKIVARETSSFLIPGVGPALALKGGVASLRRAVQSGSSDGITVPPRMKEMPLFAWMKERQTNEVSGEKYQTLRNVYRLSVKNAPIAEGSNRGQRPFDVGYRDYQSTSISGIDDAMSSQALMQRFVQPNPDLNLEQLGALSRHIEVAQIRENLDVIKTSVRKLGAIVQKGAQRVLLAPQYEILAGVNATGLGRCLPLAHVMAYALSRGKSGALINYLTDSSRGSKAFPSLGAWLGYLHGTLPATPLLGKKDIVQVANELDALNESAYWVLETPNHAILVGKSVRSGVQTFHFYDPNIGLLDYAYADDFKMAMQKSIGKKNLQTAYQIDQDGKFQVKEINLEKIGGSRLENSANARTVQQWVDSISPFSESDAALAASRVKTIEVKTQPLQLSTSNRLLNQYEIISEGGRGRKTVVEVPLGEKFRIYTALDDTPADDLDIDVHGGFIDDRLVKLPVGTEIEVMGPHGTTLQDMGIDKVLTRKYTPYATVTSDKIKFWGVGNESILDPNGGNNKYILKKLSEQAQAPKTLDEKKMAAAGTLEKGHFRDYLMGRFQDTPSAADEAPETVSDIARAIDANRKSDIVKAKRDVLVATSRAYLSRMPTGMDPNAKLAWLQEEYKHKAKKLPRISDLLKQLEYAGVRYKRIRFVACREDAMNLEVRGGDLVPKAAPPHIEPELRARNDVLPEVVQWGEATSE
ncbi:putative adhesin [Burkholderia stagnalis]|uniref:Putative adhesin Stv domain-containing protein n=1 Tax=Burkholderia stagnalis TaxID=1503054 RepID=A0ABX9YEB8_9BURK|nr:hypothetical protein [Burkholderia stagnalis]RQQ44905.1 hypothetical protein DF158_35565 [Burkholderia stagnalis]RQQ58199.1 hypothetical protein DF137_35630 [Burkholderia stagnalis]RQQ58246.1 hypothetical protein DF139_35500 [Burkholderia stagnalis]RQQ71569.1 hypothetical protein DF138_35780 [Burkholderia stagnalis]RQQ78350.1 hypothetical protein DF134_36005 [Burkholderia stagnalis]